MRNKLFAILVGAALAMVSASSVFADTGGGGTADLGLEAVTISSGSVVAKTGVVTLTGSIDCTQDLEAGVFVDLAQVVGRFNTIRGFGFTTVGCLATAGHAAFSMSFLADQGKFAPGGARVSAGADVFVCDEVTGECFEDFVSYGPASIRLKSGK